jgi:hypothetical protein
MLQCGAIINEPDGCKMMRLVCKSAVRQCQVCLGWHGAERDCPQKKELDRLMKQAGLKAEWGSVKGHLYYNALPAAAQAPRQNVGGFLGRRGFGQAFGHGGFGYGRNNRRRRYY